MAKHDKEKKIVGEITIDMEDSIYKETVVPVFIKVKNFKAHEKSEPSEEFAFEWFLKGYKEAITFLQDKDINMRIDFHTKYWNKRKENEE